LLYPLSLHDALPIFAVESVSGCVQCALGARTLPMQPFTFRVTCRERVHERVRRFAVGLSAALVVGLPALASAAGPPAQRGGVSELFSPTWWAENFGGVLSGDLFRMGWRLVIGVLLFVAGWMLAKLVSALVFRLLRNTDFD